MKKPLLLITIFINCITTNAQVASSCIVPQVLADAYYKDVRQLATSFLYQSLSPDTSLVRIPSTATDPVIEGMAAILNAPIPESDSVFNLYCVHDINGFPFEYDGYLISVDTNYAWTHAWQNMITITGDAYIDSVVTRYDLHVSAFYNWSIGNYAVLSTDSAWNPKAMIDTFLLAPGILSAETNGIIGGAGTIEYSMTGQDRYYNFYFEFSDCFDGCDNYRKWMFKVYPNCSVEYLGFVDWGYFQILPLPPPLNCNIFTSIEKNNSSSGFEIYPTVTENLIHLHNKSNNVDARYNVVDASGRNLESGIVSTSDEVIDASRLSCGIYYVKIISGNSEFFLRFVKQ